MLTGDNSFKADLVSVCSKVPARRVDRIQELHMGLYIYCLSILITFELLNRTNNINNKKVIFDIKVRIIW